MIALPGKEGLHLVLYGEVCSAAQSWFYYFIVMLLPELVILIVETAAYGFLLRERSVKRRIGYALCANLASFILGFFPIHCLASLASSL